MLNTESLFPHSGSFAMRRDDATGKCEIPVRILRNNGDGTLLTGDPVGGARRRNSASINCNVPLGDLLPATRDRCIAARGKYAYRVPA